MNLSKRICTTYFKLHTSQKGVTLIALVITIIVMLILASVTINMVFGDEGILTQAQNAGEENRAAAVREQISMWKSTRNWKTKYGIQTVEESLEEFTQDLVDKELITETEKNAIITNGQIQIGKGEPLIFEEETPTTIEFTINGKSYTVAAETYWKDAILECDLCDSSNLIYKAESGYTKFTCQCYEDGDMVFVNFYLINPDESGDPYLPVNSESMIIAGDYMLDW